MAHTTRTCHLWFKEATTMGSWLMMQSTQLRELFAQELTIGPKAFKLIMDDIREKSVNQSVEIITVEEVKF